MSLDLIPNNTMKKTGKLHGVCNGQWHCEFRECFVRHDLYCKHMPKPPSHIWQPDTGVLPTDLKEEYIHISKVVKDAEKMAKKYIKNNPTDDGFDPIGMTEDEVGANVLYDMITSSSREYGVNLIKLNMFREEKVDQCNTCQYVSGHRDDCPANLLPGLEINNPTDTQESGAHTVSLDGKDTLELPKHCFGCENRERPCTGIHYPEYGKPVTPSKDWELPLSDLLRSHDMQWNSQKAKQDVVAFIASLLAQQKKQLREKVEGMRITTPSGDCPSCNRPTIIGFHPINTIEHHSFYNQALDDILKLLV